MAFLLELVLKHVHRRHRADGHLQVYRYLRAHTSQGVQMSSRTRMLEVALTPIAMLAQAHQGPGAVSIPHRQCCNGNLHASISLA